ncbi:MAG: DUF2283 domain-containing protein [Thermoleophilia bacterium]|nr:DUF2283 domain-containing protein [Thermoleophilia bacterium]
MEYDPSVDALAIDFPRAVDGASAKLVRLDRDRALDFDSEGRLISIELLNVSRGVVLDGLLEPEVVRSALDLVGPGRPAR